MELNRNQFFLVGFVLLLLGLQFRMVDAFVLNEKSSKVVAEQLKRVGARDDSGPFSLSVSGVSSSTETLRPPKWIGWAFISVGAVLVLHSLAMPRPD